PFIKLQDISAEESKDMTRKKMQYRTSTDSYAN
ncbi:3-deoxy-D-manno-oct-2-ulosonate III transferase WaaZ, partial [Escherichia coli]|nr:3-deoxy-D-manno-oct-2-ulosonate III transferase WaaZ [Escherichia coli]EFN4182886.1 3-deoxy-D-manno-oct-2-ulosonate III transferase WaaZ [Escherichia coli]HCL7080990.1 3-deoxy-D-manno-oct-2-ulosonate III transferase WaaZ [Escherichia coli]HDD9199229.1 3-deoxy-D-manno-oct-2-ulosonate III transferase WaaZ [Escherichia coli]HDD9328211.1 3-deoxy-D-manno-oct-2-ulosonate III transferase WaaZ [Escherichia coli]